MRVRNFTPHPIILLSDGGEEIARFPSEGIARCTARQIPDGTVTIAGKSVPIVRTDFGEVTGLPVPEADTLLIVSRVVLSAVSDRNDLIVPDGIVRDDSGRIIGCTSFSR